MTTKSDAYDEYWHFAHKRNEVFRAKNDLDNSLTIDDPILEKFKFTNCYRVLDRTTQFLLREVIYSKSFSPEDTFFRTILFKLFNKIETWEHLESTLGEITLSSFNPETYCKILTTHKANASRLYSAAYIMPSGKKEYGSSVKHENNIKMLQAMIKDNLHKKVWEISDLKDLYETLLKIPTIGPFLAYQYAIDLTYSHYSSTSEEQFVVAGPGAVRGIKKCFLSLGGKSYEYVIRQMVESQQFEFEKLGIDFRYMGGRPLQLIDCQNLFCEVDKYLREKRPDLGNPNSRIKQLYRPKNNKVLYFFPPTWDIKKI